MSTPDSVPESYICPLTLDIMSDPVKASDGFVYERKTIQQWYAINQTSPFTRQLLRNRFIPQRELGKEIRAYKQQHGVSTAADKDPEGPESVAMPPPPPVAPPRHHMPLYPQQGYNTDPVSGTRVLPRLSDNGIYVHGNFITVRPRSLSVICHGCRRRIIVRNLKNYPIQRCPCGQIIGEMILRRPRGRRNTTGTCQIQ